MSTSSLTRPLRTCVERRKRKVKEPRICFVVAAAPWTCKLVFNFFPASDLCSRSTTTTKRDFIVKDLSTSCKEFGVFFLLRLCEFDSDNEEILLQKCGNFRQLWEFFFGFSIVTLCHLCDLYLIGFDRNELLKNYMRP